MIPAFVQALLCTAPEGGVPCGCCASCRAWERRAHPDYHCLEPEGASLKVEQVRQWQPFFRYRPQLGRHRVFHINRPELLTPAAANSLLKILEEPLGSAVFLLVTEDERGVLPTVVSRCRLVFFHPEEPGDVVRLPEGVLDAEKAEAIGRIIRQGTPAELLREARQLELDRAGAQALLDYLLKKFEQEYRRLRRCLQDGRGDAEWLGRVAGCLQLLLRGSKLLDENISVPLLLPLLLYKIQRRMHGLE